MKILAWSLDPFVHVDTRARAVEYIIGGISPLLITVKPLT